MFPGIFPYQPAPPGLRQVEYDQMRSRVEVWNGVLKPFTGLTLWLFNIAMV